MRLAKPMREPAAGRVVHLVGRLTDAVYDFLGPVTAELGRSGVAQVVVVLDDEHSRHLLSRFHESVDLVIAPAERGAFARWRRWLQVARRTVESMPLTALHLHGLLPCALGTAFANDDRLRGSVFWSPHRSPATRTLMWLLRPFATSQRYRAIASETEEAKALADHQSALVKLVACPIGAAFFELPRNEAQHPLILTASREPDPRGEETFAQIAVLLGGDELQVRFSWVGNVDAVSLQRLQAAGVVVLDAKNDDVRAARLAAAWIYIAPHGVRGFPHGLAEGMAIGLPCIALDTPAHRELIRHGDNGYLWRTDQELLECVAVLIDTPELRRRLGGAARDDARRRFSDGAFRDSLLEAYRLPLQ